MNNSPRKSLKLLLLLSCLVSALLCSITVRAGENEAEEKKVLFLSVCNDLLTTRESKGTWTPRVTLATIITSNKMQPTYLPILKYLPLFNQVIIFFESALIQGNPEMAERLIEFLSSQAAKKFVNGPDYFTTTQIFNAAEAILADIKNKNPVSGNDGRSPVMDEVFMNHLFSQK
jgi:hypothetical protein